MVLLLTEAVLGGQNRGHKSGHVRGGDELLGAGQRQISGEGSWEEGQRVAVTPARDSGGKCMPSREQTEPGRPSPRPETSDQARALGEQGRNWKECSDPHHLPRRGVTDSSHGGGGTVLRWLSPHSLCKSSLWAHTPQANADTKRHLALPVCGLTESTNKQMQKPGSCVQGKPRSEGTPGAGAGACGWLRNQPPVGSAGVGAAPWAGWGLAADYLGCRCMAAQAPAWCRHQSAGSGSGPPTAS